MQKLPFGAFKAMAVLQVARDRQLGRVDWLHPVGKSTRNAKAPPFACSMTCHIVQSQAYCAEVVTHRDP